MINCELCRFSFQVTWEIVKAYNVGPVVKRANPRPQSTLYGSFYQDQNIWRLNWRPRIDAFLWALFSPFSREWYFASVIVMPVRATPQLKFSWSGKKPLRSSKWLPSLFVMRADMMRSVGNAAEYFTQINHIRNQCYYKYVIAKTSRGCKGSSVRINSFAGNRTWFIFTCRQLLDQYATVPLVFGAVNLLHLKQFLYHRRCMKLVDKDTLMEN